MRRQGPLAPGGLDTERIETTWAAVWIDAPVSLSSHSDSSTLPRAQQHPSPLLSTSQSSQDGSRNVSLLCQCHPHSVNGKPCPLYLSLDYAILSPRWLLRRAYPPSCLTSCTDFGNAGGWFQTIRQSEQNPRRLRRHTALPRSIDQSK